jgi:plastocyanin
MTSSRARRLASIVLLAGVAAMLLLAAGCGGDDNDNDSDTAATTQTTETTATTGDQTGGASAQTLKVAADPQGQLKFDPDKLTAKPGETTVDFTNDSSVPHDWILEQDGKDVARTEVITKGSDNTKVNLAAGEYKYYCSVDGHRQAGMEGDLTVR